MLLSELVAYRMEIAQHDIIKSSRSLSKTLDDLISDVRENRVPDAHDKIRFGDATYLEQAENDRREIDEVLDDMETNRQFYLDQLDGAIDEIGEEYIRTSRDHFDNGWSKDEPHTILIRKLNYPKDVESKLRSRLSVYADWRYPGLCVGPMRTEFTDEMVSNDPLYVCDFDEALINPFLDQQNQVYRHRIRPYVIQKYDWNRKLFKDLPQGQFGLVFLANYMEYLPMDGIKSILAEVHDLLRPGGTCVFTFNDCDNYLNIRLCERYYRTYSPGSMVRELAKELGYKITYSYDHTYGFSWMEISKRGTLKTRKGGQALAKVISTNDATTASEKTYTEEQIKQIHQEAIALLVDSEEKIKGGAIGPGKLELLIERKKHDINEARRREEELRRKTKEFFDDARRKTPVDWSASNEGYSKGDVVRFRDEIWVALTKIIPKQKFVESEWALVK